VSEAAGDDVRCVIVDLDELTFLDAATLGWLVETRKLLSGTEAKMQVNCHTGLGRLLLTATRWTSCWPNGRA
jgi:anti-anti-sigma regulatory factor